jgi:hypothetical protein
MDRFNCPMANCFEDEIYCGYYDVFYMKCFENKDCPEENGDHEDDQEYEYEDGLPNW